MKDKSIAIIGAGGLGRETRALLERTHQFAGFYDDRESSDDHLGTLDRISNTEYLNYLIAIGAPQVKKSIARLLNSGRRETEKFLGKGVLYFPVFDQYLERYQLPEELRFLPVVESRLKPNATSAAGASGLWQFMPATARAYELNVNRKVDERLDPHKSTEAAVSLLADLYEEFGDWGLALAAYNCGPSRVKRAIRKTGCNNFWDIRKYLPRQTQQYIPAFLAAVYVCRNFELHNLEPRFPEGAKSDDRLSHMMIIKKTHSLENSAPKNQLAGPMIGPPRGVFSTSFPLLSACSGSNSSLFLRKKNFYYSDPQRLV